MIEFISSLTYNQFWTIFFPLSVLAIVGVLIWLFYPLRKYYVQKLKKNE